MGDIAAGPERGSRVVEEAHVGEDSVHAPVGGILVERHWDRLVVRRGKSGPVWVPVRCDPRKIDLLGCGVAPPHPREEFADRLRRDAEPPRNLTRRQSLSLQAANQLRPRRRQPGPAGGVAAPTAQGGEPARLEPTLVAPETARQDEAADDHDAMPNPASARGSDR